MVVRTEVFKMTGQKWYFEDCMVEEKENYFTVHVERNCIYGSQEVVPSCEKDFEECRKRLDEGEDPLWLWEDGSGVVVGYGMESSLNSIVGLVRAWKYFGGQVEVEKDVDAIIYGSEDDNRRLVMYLGKTFGDDFPTDDEVLNNVIKFAFIKGDEKIPKYYDDDVLFKVEDEEEYFREVE